MSSGIVMNGPTPIMLRHVQRRGLQQAEPALEPVGLAGVLGEGVRLSSGGAKYTRRHVWPPASH